MTKAQKRWAEGPAEAGHQALCGYGAGKRSLGSPPQLPSCLPHAPSFRPPFPQGRVPPEAGLKRGHSDPSPEVGRRRPRERPGPWGSPCRSAREGRLGADPLSSREGRALPRMLSRRQKPGARAARVAGCPRQARRKGHEAGRRGSQERTPRGPEPPAWRGPVNRRGARMRLHARPTQNARLSVSLWSLQHARQALGQEGLQGASGVPPPPPAPGEANLARTRAGAQGREQAGISPGQSIARCWGWGQKSHGGAGDRVGAERVTAAGPPWPQPVPTCHRPRTSHRGTGVAPSILCPWPSSAGVALYKYS